MNRSALRGFLRSDSANVAPTVALALFALIGVGGIAFDYSRLASLDTELQNGADQAALAAAGQLDGQAGACARAAAAAADLLANETLFANDSTASRGIVVQNEAMCDDDGSVRFYQSYDKVTDTFGAEATTDAEARVVAVTVDPREAFYALTPVVGAFSSGAIAASAVASLGSAICKVPPVMMCNPAEPETNTDINFPFTAVEGQGLRLVIGSPDAPGNFGFLRTDAGGAKQTAKNIGYDNPPSGCIGTNGVETEPGNMISVRAAFNTRFDISENGETTCPDGGTCSPSINSRKDLVRPTTGGGCELSNTAWQEAPNPYRAPNALPLNETTNPNEVGGPWPDVMGYPRDLCHAMSVEGECAPDSSIIGDGVWDIDAYFWVNYGWDRFEWISGTGGQLAATDADVPSVTRYDVYKWEMANPSLVVNPSGTNPGTSYTIPGTTLTSHSTPVCRGPGITPDATTPDRRRISVAVINCNAQNLKGHEENVQVLKWIDVFLVAPAIARGNGPEARSTIGDIYVEVIEETASGGSSDTAVTRRDVPYLIR